MHSRWKAYREFAKQFTRDEIADIHEYLMGQEEEFDEDGSMPDEEKLLIMLCAMVGMCKMVEEIWREELKKS